MFAGRVLSENMVRLWRLRHGEDCAGLERSAEVLAALEQVLGGPCSCWKLQDREVLGENALRANIANPSSSFCIISSGHTNNFKWLALPLTSDYTPERSGLIPT